MTRFLVSETAESYQVGANLKLIEALACVSIFLTALLLSTGSNFAADSTVIAPGAHLEKLAEGYAHTEGPAADSQGNVYFTDYGNNLIVKWHAADGKLSDWLKPSGSAIGISFDHVGNLIAAASEKGELWSIAPDKTVTVLLAAFDGKVFNGPDDVWIRPDGGIYFTDPDFHSTHDQKTRVEGQNVYFMTPDRKTVRRVTMDIFKPSGITGTGDGKVLYVADYGAAQTYAYDINPNGDLTNKRLFCNLGSEGMTIDNEGNVYLAQSGGTVFGVTVFDKAGKKIEYIELPEMPTNLAFGGKDKDMLFITAAGSVYGLKMRVNGLH
ncbi:SMP-30/gluconolactonase/LRE family protein [Neorhizobium sp. P12A]|nr:SMP-30/gluconolactonase/LRE family protein [Neorhizobium sp. P12A]